MLKFGVVLSILLFVLPVTGSAHMSMMYPDEHGYGMMRTIEERSMNETVHEEMEGLMIGMMEGNLTPAEQERLVELMDRYPAGYSTMMDRMLYTQSDVYPHMLEGEFWTGMPWWMVAMMVVTMLGGIVFGLVWLVVGILAIIWLLRQNRRP
jgi:hypothetical protein